MAMPGFTAELSLAQGGEHYRAGSRQALDGSTQVVPQARPTGDCIRWCRGGGGDWPECWYYCVFL